MTLLEALLFYGSVLALLVVGALAGYAVCYWRHRDKIRSMMAHSAPLPGIDFQAIRMAYRKGQDDAAKEVMETVYKANKMNVL